jgi:glycosyltransferase involved in cell wall biosynthesis
MISVVMITMNEEPAVGKVIGDIKAHAPDAEILIVDSSRDRTPEIARSLGARVIRQFPPQGYGNAMALALGSAQGEVIVTLDCDNTYPAVMIPVLADTILKEGYDLVDGSRLKRKPKTMPMANFLANRFFALLASVLFLRRITDLHSGMRAYRSSMIRTLRFDPKGAALPVELLLRIIRSDFKVKFVFIDYRDRIGRSTLRPLSSAVWTLRRILRVRFGK